MRKEWWRGCDAYAEQLDREEEIQELREVIDAQNVLVAWLLAQLERRAHGDDSRHEREALLPVRPAGR